MHPGLVRAAIGGEVRMFAEKICDLKGFLANRIVGSDVIGRVEKLLVKLGTRHKVAHL